MKNKFLFKLVICALIMQTCGSCCRAWRDSQPEMAAKSNAGGVDEKSYDLKKKLLPESEAISISAAKAVIHGNLTPDDIRALCRQVGRVPGVFHTIGAVWACWEESVVAAKVQAGNYLIFCVRDINGHWQISDVVRVEM